MGARAETQAWRRSRVDAQSGGHPKTAARWSLLLTAASQTLFGGAIIRVGEPKQAAHAGHWRDKPKPDYLSTMSHGTWRNATLKERTIHVLNAVIGVREVGWNWGAKVQQFLAAAGVFVPAPWCAALLTWALLEAGADRRKLPKYPASTYFWWAWARECGRLRPVYAGSRGDFLVGNSGGGHIAAIRAVVDNKDGDPRDGDFTHYSTIEGNTNAQGSREGHQVARRTRTPAWALSYRRSGVIHIDDYLGVAG